MIANQKKTQKCFLYSSSCIALFAAFLLSSCTATSSGSSSLQMSSGTDSSLVAEALQTAADEKLAEEGANSPGTVATTATVEAITPDKNAQKSTLTAALFPTPKSTDVFTAIKPQAGTSEQSKPQNAEAITAPAKPKDDEKPVVLASNLSKPSLELKKQPSAQSYNYALPGVRANGGLEIKHRNAVYDDSDIDADEEDDGPELLRVSAPGLARLAPNGLKVQRESVDVACLKPELVKTLRKLESHFRKPVIVTSGYRSPSYNVKVKGARKSLHMICAAADIQIEGVSKWEIARVARAMPSRGGVGTYCHTKSVHIDIGPERDWNWKCRGKS
ncbi:YcbK family protein [Brucellaceae bacterium C25G]